MCGLRVRSLGPIRLCRLTIVVRLRARVIVADLRSVRLAAVIRPGARTGRLLLGAGNVGLGCVRLLGLRLLLLDRAGDRLGARASGGGRFDAVLTTPGAGSVRRTWCIGRPLRSEERRVGQEWRALWRTYHSETKCDQHL